MSQDLHVVFGAGQIGTPLVRLVRRCGPGPEGIETRQGDAGDPAFAAEATSGSSACASCVRWATSGTSRSS